MRPFRERASGQNGRLKPLHMDKTQRREHSSTATFDARIRRFYLTLPSLALAPAPIWRTQNAMEVSTSPTQSSVRKTRDTACSPLPTPSFLSLCRRVVRLAQTCMPSSRSSPSDGYRAKVGNTLQRVPVSGGEHGSSPSSAVFLFCFITGTFIPHPLSPL